MIVVPAIDLLGGKAVRLHKGRYDEVTVFDDDPVARAKAFRAAGAERLHVVDLEGAKAGKCMQIATVRAIAAAFGPGVQAGGGVRSVEAAESYFAAGAERVVLGTFALNEPALVRGLCKNHPDRVIIAVDAKDGLVATSGWTEVSAVTATELALRFRDLALFGVLYTDIARDGTRSGPNVEATAALARDTGISIIASGGVGTLGDLRALSQHPGIDAAIVGRAIYDKIFSVEDAIAAARGP
jgi:phosphoribosylformimino-5-aminoimidazole carboxamide ribotide isomerase